MRTSILLLLTIGLSGSECNHEWHKTHEWGPTLPAEPICDSSIFPVEPTSEKYSSSQIDQIEKNVLGALDKFKSTLNDSRFKRITQTIQLYVMLAKNEDSIIKSLKEKDAIDEVIGGLQHQYNLIWQGEQQAPFEATLAGHGETGIRENLREGVHLLAIAFDFLHKNENSWRDFFESAFLDGWTCIPARLNTLRPWVETRIKGQPVERALFYQISAFKADTMDSDISKPGHPFSHLSGRLLIYYQTNVLLRSLFENPSNRFKPISEIYGLPEFNAGYTRDKISEWIFTHVKKSYEVNNRHAEWQKTAFSNKANIETAISSWVP